MRKEKNHKVGNLKRVFAFVFAWMILCASACGSGAQSEEPIPRPEPPRPEQPEPTEDSLYSSYLAEKELEKDFVYMWNESSLGKGRNVCFQTQDYALKIDGGTGKILKIGHYRTRTSGKYTQCDFESLANVNTSVFITENGKRYNAQYGRKYPQIVSSGRWLQLFNQGYVPYKNQNGEEFSSRIEVCAMRDHFVLVHETYSETSRTITQSMQWNIEGYIGESVYDGRGIFVHGEDGTGFIFLKPRGFEYDLIFQNGILTMRKRNLALKPKTYAGCSVLVYPASTGDFSKAEELFAIEEADLKILSTKPQKDGATLKFDPEYGALRLNTDRLNAGAQDTEQGRNTYEETVFSIENTKEEPISPTVLLDKKIHSASGYSFLLRDPVTHIPTGEPVQISKNWPNGRHISYHDDFYDGGWMKSATRFVIPPKQKLTRELIVPQAKWGETYAASHSQLCLLGWPGEKYEVWDEAALGAWGENVTYDPNIGLGRSTIDDVRPFLVVSQKTGRGKKYNWTGNVGGGSFLNYLSRKDGEQRVADQKIFYKTQAPNLTHVNYSGITDDHKIAADITINLGRTNDIVRNYYTLKYTFLEDVEYGRLSFFQISADRYSDNRYRKYVYGDESGLLKSGKANSSPYGPITDFEVPKNKGFWFALLDSSDRDDENANLLVAVRGYKAVLNGKTYDKPAFRLFGTENNISQTAVEFGVPKEMTTIKKGSTVELNVEYSIIPDNLKDYYGDCDYLLASDKILGTSDAMLQQVLYGKQTVSVQKGELVGEYPLTIAKRSDEREISFRLRGGLGYVPLRFVGLEANDYILQQKVNGVFETVNQSMHGNDFWQTYLNPNDKTYEMCFNVRNTIGTKFQTENEYRLVRKTV